MSDFNLESFGTQSRENLVSLAKIAEGAERYDDMCKLVKEVIKKDANLSVDDRNLVSVAYKNVVGTRRASWRTIHGDGNTEEETKELTKTYKGIIENELDAICQDVLSLLTDHLIPSVKDQGNETEVFYLKMAGDYYRYLAEFKPEQGENAAKFYQQALEIAQEKLHETHPTRLGLALNYSVCYYEILKKPDKACELAKKAFDDAIQKLDSLDDASYKDSTLIMQLLRDNLTLWTSENPGEEDGEDGESPKD